MKFVNKYERRKRVVIILWVIVSGIIIWFFNLLPQALDFKSLLNFLCIFLGGGFAFHFLTELVKTPISESSWAIWGTLEAQLCWAAFIIMLLFAVVIFEKYVYSLGGLMIIVGFLVEAWILTNRAEQGHKLLIEIKNAEFAND